MSEPLTSAEQDSWKELAQVIRLQLRRVAQYIPAMNPEEIKNFVETARDAMWLEINAATYDVLKEREEVGKTFE